MAAPRRKYLPWGMCLPLLLVCTAVVFAENPEDGLAHLKLAWSHAEHDEWASSAREATAAVSLLRESGKKGNLIDALEVLGNSEVMLGQPAQAAEHFLEGLSACGSCADQNLLRLGLASATRD